MLFFLNDNIQRNKSGIEHAQIKRLHLFEKYHQPAKIVTRQYSNELHLVTAEAGIDDRNFIIFKRLVRSRKRIFGLKIFRLTPIGSAKLMGLIIIIIKMANVFSIFVGAVILIGG